MTFKQRLQQVLAGRALTAWGRNNGLSGGTISRISGDQVPGHQILNLIHKIENVSLDWLVHGHGAPFLVHEELADSRAAEYLRQLLDERDWRLTVLSDGSLAAVVATQPAQLEFKGKPIDYTACEVLTGTLGPLVLQLLNEQPRLHCQRVDRQAMADLYTGRLGAWLLAGEAGLVNKAEPVERLELSDLYEPDQVGEAAPDYQADELLARIQRLTPHNRESVSLIVDTLLEGQNQ